MYFNLVRLCEKHNCHKNMCQNEENESEEDFLIRVQQLNGLVGLVLELGDEGAIDDGVLGLHGGPNGDALLVDDDDAEHSLMRVDSIQSFLYLLRGVGRCLCHCCTDISINQNYC